MPALPDEPSWPAAAEELDLVTDDSRPVGGNGSRRPLHEALRRRGRSIRDLSQASGVSQSTIYRIMATGSMQPNTARRLLVALDGWPELPNADLLVGPAGNGKAGP